MIPTCHITPTDIYDVPGTTITVIGIQVIEFITTLQYYQAKSREIAVKTARRLFTGILVNVRGLNDERIES